MNKYKKDFPIFNSKKGGFPLIYLDSAATSQKPQAVIDAVEEFYKEYNSNIHRGLYKIAEKATEKVEEVRKKVAKFINANDPTEIVFTHGTTEGINMLASSLSKEFSSTRGVLLSEMEHHSNLVPWQHYAKGNNAPLDFLAVNKEGRLENKGVLRNRRKTSFNTNNYSVISLTHVSNVLGTINTIPEIIKNNYSRGNKPFVVVDAAQSVPHLKVDVQELDCDFLVFSGHKMFSPSGVGVLYGKHKLLNKLNPFLYGSQMIKEVTLKKATYQDAPEKFESGTMPLEGIIGLGAAIDYLNHIGMNTIHDHEVRLTSYALGKLSKIQGLRVYGPQDSLDRSGVISFSIAGVHPHDIAQVLGSQNVCVRAGHHCAMPLHKALGIPATVRVSFHIYNDEQDVDALLKGINEVKRVFLIG